jgi:hypothetical protein
MENEFFIVSAILAHQEERATVLINHHFLLERLLIDIRLMKTPGTGLSANV